VQAVVEIRTLGYSGPRSVVAATAVLVHAALLMHGQSQRACSFNFHQYSGGGADLVVTSDRENIHEVAVTSDGGRPRPALLAPLQFHRTVPRVLRLFLSAVSHATPAPTL